LITQLSGILLEKKPPFIVVEVAGIGYELQVSMTTFYTLASEGSSIKIYTQFIVREEAQLLYGFTNKIERNAFNELIKVSGVGPKLALTILSGMNSDALATCINNKEVGRLVKLPGVGKKTAERLIVEMQNKLLSHPSFKVNSEIQDAISALVALGYKEKDALSAVNKLADNYPDSQSLIKNALQEMN